MMAAEVFAGSTGPDKTVTPRGKRETREVGLLALPFAAVARRRREPGRQERKEKEQSMALIFYCSGTDRCSRKQVPPCCCSADRVDEDKEQNNLILNLCTLSPMKLLSLFLALFRMCELPPENFSRNWSNRTAVVGTYPLSRVTLEGHLKPKLKPKLKRFY